MRYLVLALVLFMVAIPVGGCGGSDGDCVPTCQSCVVDDDCCGFFGGTSCLFFGEAGFLCSVPKGSCSSTPPAS